MSNTTTSIRSVRAIRLLAALALGLVGPLLGPAAGQADTTSQTSYPVSVSCPPGGGELCATPFTVPVQTSSTLLAQFTASPEHCSAIRVYFALDGVLSRVSGFLAAGSSTGFVDLGPVGPGPHTVSLVAEGTPGGCNA